MKGDVILHDAGTGRWLAFRSPRAILQADRLDDVQPQLRRLEAAAEAGAHAAGFISYEAAPAFDPALTAHPPDGFPLLWFGLYDAPEIIPAPAPGPEPAHTLGAWTPNVERAAYAQAIARIKDHIARGDTYQVNYTLRLRAPFTGDPWSLFAALADAQRARYAAFIDLGRRAVCSASPELFFNLDGRRLEARPMKGTAARGRTLAEDQAQAARLRASEKNRAENVMIVDMLRNDLGRIAAVGSVAAPALFTVERYPTVWQMTSTVTAASDAPLTEILAALSPCASITGAPKPRTMRIIRELEPEPRRLYTGAIGFVAPAGAGRPRRAQFNVAIRTVLVDREAGQAEYGVGGGIVWDSDAADEYAECQIKARVLQRRPSAFQLLESLRWEPDAGYERLDRHLARLRASADYFDFALDLEQARAELLALARTLTGRAHKVRLRVDRAGAVLCTAEPITPPAGPAQLALAPGPVDSGDVFLYHKTTRRDVYAAARAACPDADDTVLWNERGEITEACFGNLAVQLGGVWVTPPVECGLLAGVYRAELLAEGQLAERVITRADLAQAQGLAVLNSVRRWREAVLMETSFGNG